ncbi:MAG TPA: tRNA 2-selenouridine(34) synthase MnmH [Caulobacteraceae bacterium]|jgi:tRNA 2-selenouridine synthase|nr:tRNA 2-selenouridine(34) synthase MnmH [Caulobacteraceae bacterium]
MAEVGVARDAEPATLAGFDVIIDARSPGEFAIDHIPGAVNLPVLADAERAEVGTIYVQESPFKARRVGGAYVARNVARHIEAVMADWPASLQPLVYCWRGGMRSNSMAVILASVGWRTSVMAGGYRTYRRRVVQRLYDDEPLPKVVLLDGHTGSGKTEVLGRLPAHGVQTLDLEDLAAHRGSLFGALPGRAQPSQKLFESRLLAAVEGLDWSRPVVVEAESSKIGQLITPPVLWRAMEAAPRVVLTAPVEARARYLARTYADLGDDPENLIALLSRLPDPVGRKRLEAWTAMARAGDLQALAAALIEAHYDPAYRRSGRKADGAVIGEALLTRLDAEAFEQAARTVAGMAASV